MVSKMAERSLKLWLGELPWLLGGASTFWRKGNRGSILGHPIPRLQHLDQPGLEGAGLIHYRRPTGRERRQTHQHALDPGACLQPEQGAPVMNQVELHVPS